jgi:predicted enzyme related to lactoylglutathione lyase
VSTPADIAHVHHAIDYVEIAVTDLDAAKAFYATRFHDAECTGAYLFCTDTRR